MALCRLCNQADLPPNETINGASRCKKCYAVVLVGAAADVLRCAI